MSQSEPPTPRKNLYGKSPSVDRRSHVTSAIKNNKRNKQQRRDNSDSEDSDDHESLESEQTDSMESKSGPVRRGRHQRAGDWQILDGLRDGQRCEDTPEKYEGMLMKRRKWPMKGWHKRYFVMEKGILTYAKSMTDIQKGKLHGTVDIGVSFLTYKRENRRIDIDADVLYHLKVKNTVLFDEWLSRMQHHRLYRQHELNYGTKEVPKLTDVTTPVEELTPITSPVSPGPALMVTDHARHGSFKGRSHSIYDRSQSKVTAWLLDSAGIEQCQKDVSAAQARMFELNSLLEKLNHCAQLQKSDGLVEFQDLGSSTKKKKVPTATLR